uniref:Uncharacterized protein n=1 Tax=Acrobeloides nanus TaxID=290746 RepID=A0A914BWA4_9BILA
MMLKEPNGPNGSWPTLPSYRRAMKTTTVLPITTEQPIPLEVQPPAYMDTFITGNAPPLYFESSINPSDGLPSRNTNNAEVI